MPGEIKNQQMQSKDLNKFYSMLRYPTERRALVVTLMAVILLLLIFTGLSLGLALVFAALLLWLTSTLVQISFRRHVGNSVRVSRAQFPEVAKELAAAAQAVRSPALNAFVYQDMRINAYAFGWKSPQALVLTSQLVSDLNFDELRFVAGHEMGHIALGHTRLGSLVGGVLGTPAVPFLTALLVPVFLWWSRCAEYSADRAGLLACGQLKASISALLKVLVGPDLAIRINVEELLQQSHELQGQMDALAGEMSGSHPYMVHRLRRLIEFWKSETCQRLLAESGRK